MAEGKRTLAFQVSEEFFAEVQTYVKSHKLKLRDFGILAMRRIMDAPAAEPNTDDTPGETEAPAEQK
jgi:hypothetical protein